MNRRGHITGTILAGASIAIIAAAGGWTPSPAPAAEPEPVTQGELAHVVRRLDAIDARVSRLDDRQFWQWVLCGGGATTGSAVGAALALRRRPHTGRLSP